MITLKKNREYFMLINQDLPEEKWLINCILICSGNPRIKPRRRYVVTNKKNITILDYICSSFKIVKWLFKFFADGQIFDSPKLFQFCFNFSATTLLMVALPAPLNPVNQRMSPFSI